MEKLRLEFREMSDAEKDTWEQKREIELRRSWVCCDCGKKLSRSGMVWSFRLKNHIKNNFFSDDPASGCRCDSCAEIAENGGY